MRDLLTQPLCEARDLGRPIPDCLHAVSVAMPTWDSVVGYEEEDPEVRGALQCGYPRFFCHPLVEKLFHQATAQFAVQGETAVVFPTMEACQRCAAFLEGSGEEGVKTRTLSWPGSSAGVLLLPDGQRMAALRYWRYTGEMVSSRQAEALLQGQGPASGDRDEVTGALCRQLASWSRQPAENGHLYASGMAAIFSAFRAVSALRPRGITVQLEFPYVDVLCIQKVFGEGAHLLRGGGETDLMADLEKVLRDEEVRAVFCEIPCNPLNRTVDLPEVSRLCRAAGVPLVVDDTLGTVHNVDVYPYADLVTTSLTKNISGRGDVMAGSVWVAEGSPWAKDLQAFLKTDVAAPLYLADAEALLANCADFPQRMERINANGAALVEFLAEQPEVEALYYPSRHTQEHYEKVRRPGGGYGGLVSMVLRGGEVTARAFYDALEANKGPSLGTNYTLVCPYTLLAHYEELDWAEACGVSRNLIRVAVGLEPIEILRERFGRAFRVAFPSASSHRGRED